jgi:HK97 family phage major capsid protein
MADITRAQLATLIQEAYSHVLLDAAVTTSCALQAFPTVNMGTKLTHLPVLATLPVAGWVTENEPPDTTGAKPTSTVGWVDRTLVAEEIAVIIPIHENVLEDASVDLITEITTRGGEAMGEVLDQAILFGVNKPASWVSADLFTASTGATQTTPGNTPAVTAGAKDLVGAVNTASRELANVGLIPDTIIAPLTFRYDVEQIRDSMGQPIFRNEQFAGYNTVLCKNAAWNPASAVLFVADSRRIRIGVRQDIQVKILDQATIGTTNLAERDMIAVRMKARYAYVLGVSATRRNANASPIAAVVPSGS